MAKSADAFRTISEVADWLGSPAHVLRFWESKFTQVKPVKRAGGRRYYRPADMMLLGGIKALLHDDGMTIKGVQKILREQGVKHVSSLSQPLDLETATLEQNARGTVPKPTPEPAPESAQVVQFQPADAAAEPASEDAEVGALDDAQSSETTTEPDAGPDEETIGSQPGKPVDGDPASDTRVFEDFAAPAAADGDLYSGTQSTESLQGDAQADDKSADEMVADSAEDTTPTQSAAPAPELPAFLHRSRPGVTADSATPSDELEGPDTAESMAASDAATTPPPRPARVDVPADPADDDITAPPGILTRLAQRKGNALSGTALQDLATLRDKLATLQSRLSDAAAE